MVTIALKTKPLDHIIDSEVFLIELMSLAETRRAHSLLRLASYHRQSL